MNTYNSIEIKDQDKTLEFVECVVKAVKMARTIFHKCEVKTKNAREALYCDDMEYMSAAKETIKKCLKKLLEDSGKFSKREIELFLL